jgi:hypothetical protein
MISILMSIVILAGCHNATDQSAIPTKYTIIWAPGAGKYRAIYNTNHIELTEMGLRFVIEKVRVSPKYGVGNTPGDIVTLESGYMIIDRRPTDVIMPEEKVGS